MEHWPYNPANRGYILVYKPNPHSPRTQVFTSLYHHYPPGPGIFLYPPVGVELPWAASPHKGKASLERSVSRAIGSGCFYCCFLLFCLTVGLCSRPARHIALHPGTDSSPTQSATAPAHKPALLQGSGANVPTHGNVSEGWPILGKFALLLPPMQATGAVRHVPHRLAVSPPALQRHFSVRTPSITRPVHLSKAHPIWKRTQTTKSTRTIKNQFRFQMRFSETLFQGRQ